MNTDLNIDNYNLADITRLFQISYDFGEAELKDAKKIVMQMHPDKSNLDKEYFLFFSAAYKILYAIYQFRFKRNLSTEYASIDSTANDAIVKDLLNNTIVKKDFNKWFNTLFEQTKITDEYSENGYGDWLKSNEDLDDYNNVAKQDIDGKFQEKKKQLQSLIVHEDFKEFGQSQYELARDKPEYYSSDIFSKLNFEDLKRAHVESVIPITHDDYLNRKKFNSLEELQNERGRAIKPTSQDESRDFLNNKQKLDSNNDIQRAYRLVKQDEKAKEANNKWWASIRHIL